MEIKGLDNIVDFLEQKNYKIAYHYEQRYEKAKEKVHEFWGLAYSKEGFSVQVYELALRDIKKWRNKFLIEQLEKNNQAVGVLDSHTMNLVDCNFNEFKDFISVAITTLQTLEEEIILKLSKLQENKAEHQTITKSQKSKAVKNPNPDQKKFLKAFVKNLADGHKITYAIETACESSKSSQKHGYNLYKEVREGSLKYEPLSEILNERKQLNNNNVID